MKIQLGKTPEDLEREEAARQREIEAAIQKRALERQAKIEYLHKAQIRNKIIIISVVVLLVGSLLTFGIYNTWFKKSITEEEVYSIAVNTQNYYPKDGIARYLSNNIQNLFNKYITFDDETIDNIEVDKTSLYVTKIMTVNNSVAQVEFSVDVTVKEKDSQVTDEYIINTLRENGFSENNISSVEDILATEEVVEEIPEATATDAVEETTNEPDATLTLTDANGNIIDEATIGGDVTEEATTEEIVATEETTTEEYTDDTITIIPDSITYVDNSTKEKHEYYLKGSLIYQVGKTYTANYIFTVPIEYYKIPDGEPGAGGSGYRVVGEMSLQSFFRDDLETFDNITVDSNYAFNPNAKVDAEVEKRAQSKVDKILNNLYLHADVNEEFSNTYVFNTYDAEYAGINSFEFYNADNGIGFNAHVTYKIKLNGFTYMVNAYLYLEQNGDTWKITKYM